MKKLLGTLLSFGLAGLPAAEAATSYVPIVFRQESGTRPFVKAMLNGKPLLMMVHANASMYLMTTHANAALVGIGNLAKDADYGITSAGHVSTLGWSKTVLPSLLIAGPTVHDVPLQVFEIPQDPPTDGMLGIDWLRDQKVIVDYDSARIGISDTLGDAQAEDAKLVAKGYVPHKMIWDSSVDRYKINGSFGGVPVTFTMSTVSGNFVDKNLADRLGFVLGPVVDQSGGPQGALVPTYILKRPQPTSIDGQPVEAMQPHVFDIAAYESEKPNAPISVNFVLGADFMLANDAIIDFATETLLLPRLPEKPS